MTPRLYLTLLLPTVVMGGCGGEEDRPAVWSYISPAIIQPNCATSSCHNKAAAVGGLDFSTVDDGYRGLTTQRLPDAPGAGDTRTETPRRLIQVETAARTGNPDQSRLVNMLRARGTERMPPDRPLAEADIALIERWILVGAPR